MTSPNDRRAELLEQLALAGRVSSAATVMFHTAVAARQGLSASEEKALDLLERSGPLTAGGRRIDEFMKASSRGLHAPVMAAGLS